MSAPEQLALFDLTDTDLGWTEAIHDHVGEEVA